MAEMKWITTRASSISPWSSLTGCTESESIVTIRYFSFFKTFLLLKFSYFHKVSSGIDVERTIVAFIIY